MLTARTLAIWSSCRLVDAALSRRAKRISGLSAVVVQRSRSRKRYERQGVLAEAEAIERAEQECLSDAAARARHRERDEARRADEDMRFQAEFAAAIRTLFPRCPPSSADATARHAVMRGSGRIGRSAAGRALNSDAVRLAVAASVRHVDTHDEQAEWARLSRTIHLLEGAATGLGISSGGAVIVHPDAAIEPLRRPAHEFRFEDTRVTHSLLCAEEGN